MLDKVCVEKYSVNRSNARHLMKRKNKEIESNAEETIRIERIKQIILQEQDLANIKLNHEETMAAIKEEHQKEFNNLQLKHLKEIHEEEMKIKKAKLNSIILQQKENIDPDI